MFSRTCERESEAVLLGQEAGRVGPQAGPQVGAQVGLLPGKPDAALAAHLSTCAACREAFDVARYMTRLATETDAIAATRPLPEPAQLWWKARLLQRWNAETRATAPLDWMQRVEVVGGLVAVAILLVIFWSDVRGGQASTSIAANFWPTVASLLAPGALSSLIAGGLLLIGCISLFTLRQLLVED
jgi:predicted anti-sigma-YlaC factor YlaD